MSEVVKFSLTACGETQVANPYWSEAVALQGGQEPPTLTRLQLLFSVEGREELADLQRAAEDKVCDEVERAGAKIESLATESVKRLTQLRQDLADVEQRLGAAEAVPKRLTAEWRQALQRGDEETAALIDAELPAANAAVNRLQSRREMLRSAVAEAERAAAGEREAALHEMKARKLHQLSAAADKAKAELESAVGRLLVEYLRAQAALDGVGVSARPPILTAPPRPQHVPDQPRQFIPPFAKPGL